MLVILISFLRREITKVKKQSIESILKFYTRIAAALLSSLRPELIYRRILKNSQLRESCVVGSAHIYCVSFLQSKGQHLLLTSDLNRNTGPNLSPSPQV